MRSTLIQFLIVKKQDVASKYAHNQLRQQLTLATEQKVKEVKEAKKAKKAAAVVVVETPEETAAFLATAKGQSQPPKTVSCLTDNHFITLLTNMFYYVTRVLT